MDRNYEPTVKSCFDDIIKDGPNVNTGILEIIDNMIEWGKANKVKVKYVETCPEKSRPFLEMSDNSKIGFGNQESIERFFKLGKTNMNASENTIGKYGKGGYKAIIAMSDMFELITHIGDKTYTCGTNFRIMEEKNSWEPTFTLKMTDNKESNTGSTFKIYFSFNTQIGTVFSLSELKRHIIRGYHCIPKDIRFIFVRNNCDEEEFMAKDYSPYGEYVSNKTYYVYSNGGDRDEMFTVTEDEKENPFAIIDSYILKDTITKNKFLGKEGNKSPGIDFYRNNRMCNTRYPISKIGDVGGLLMKGQMRGKRCHLTVKFTDKKVSENKTFDSFIGVTTVKDIYEDDRMDKSLINIFEKVAEECSDNYELYIQKQKDGVNQYLSSIQKYVFSLTSDEKYLNDKMLTEYETDLDNFTTYKLTYYDEITDKIIIAKSKVEVKEQKANGNKPHRSNSNPITQANHLLSQVKRAIYKKKQIMEDKKKIEEIMEAMGVDQNEAKKIYKLEKEKEVEEKTLAKKKRQEEEEERGAKLLDEKKKKEEAAAAEKKKKEEAAADKKKKEEEEEKCNLESRVKKMSLEDLQKFWIESMMNHN